jgi:xylulokinase
MGIINAGSAFLSLGTSGVLFAANDSFLPNPASAVHAFCHALPQKWHQMGVILSATDALNWLGGITGISAGPLTEELGEELHAPSGVVFLPYLSGERTPHNDASIRGIFAGLDHATGRQQMTQALLEGVGFAFRDCLAALEAAGSKIGRVTAVGGGANSIYWLKAMATILNLPVDVPVNGDFGAAFGAARLAMIAAENCDPLTVCTMPETAITIEPQQKLVAAFDHAYSRYSSLYPALKDLAT